MNQQAVEKDITQNIVRGSRRGMDSSHRPPPTIQRDHSTLGPLPPLRLSSSQPHSPIPRQQSALRPPSESEYFNDQVERNSMGEPNGYFHYDSTLHSPTGATSATPTRNVINVHGQSRSPDEWPQSDPRDMRSSMDPVYPNRTRTTASENRVESHAGLPTITQILVPRTTHAPASKSGQVADYSYPQNQKAELLGGADSSHSEHLHSILSPSSFYSGHQPKSNSSDCIIAEKMVDSDVSGPLSHGRDLVEFVHPRVKTLSDSSAPTSGGYPFLAIKKLQSSLKWRWMIAMIVALLALALAATSYYQASRSQTIATGAIGLEQLHPDVQASLRSLTQLNTTLTFFNSSTAGQQGIQLGSSDTIYEPFVLTRPPAALGTSTTSLIIQGQDSTVTSSSSSGTVSGGSVIIMPGQGQVGVVNLSVWIDSSANTAPVVRRLLSSDNSNSNDNGNDNHAQIPVAVVSVASNASSTSMQVNATTVAVVSTSSVSLSTSSGNGASSKMAAAGSTIDIIATSDGNGHGVGLAVATGICNNPHVADLCAPSNSSITDESSNSTSNIGLTFGLNVSAVVVASDHVLVLHGDEAVQLSSIHSLAVLSNDSIIIQAHFELNSTTNDESDTQSNNNDRIGRMIKYPPEHGIVEINHVRFSGGDVFMGNESCSARHYLTHIGAPHSSASKCPGATALDSDFVIGSAANNVILQGIRFDDSHGISGVQKLQVDQINVTQLHIQPYACSTSLTAFDPSMQSVDVLPHIPALNTSRTSLTVLMNNSFIWLPLFSDGGGEHISVLVASDGDASFYLLAPSDSLINGNQWWRVPGYVRVVECDHVRSGTWICSARGGITDDNLQSQLVTTQLLVNTLLARVIALETAAASDIDNDTTLVQPISSRLSSLESTVAVLEIAVLHPPLPTCLSTVCDITNSNTLQIASLNQSMLAAETHLQTEIDVISSQLSSTNRQLNDSLQINIEESLVQMALLKQEIMSVNSSIVAQFNLTQADSASQFMQLHQTVATLNLTTMNSFTQVWNALESDHAQMGSMNASLWTELASASVLEKSDVASLWSSLSLINLTLNSDINSMAHQIAVDQQSTDEQMVHFFQQLSSINSSLMLAISSVSLAGAATNSLLIQVNLSQHQNDLRLNQLNTTVGMDILLLQGKQTELSASMSQLLQLLNESISELRITQNNITATQPTPTTESVLANVHIRPPTTQSFLSGSGVYITPPGVSYIKILAVGGGGGGGGSGSSAQYTGDDEGSNGGNTIFGTIISAGGGHGGTRGSFGGAGGAGGIATSTAIPNGFAIDGAFGGGGFYGANGAGVLNSPGGLGGNTYLGGGGGGSYANLIPGITNTGGGGGGGLQSSINAPAGGGGGAGATISTIITSPDAMYNYTVGIGGIGGPAGTNGQIGANGGSGIIVVEEYYGFDGVNMTTISQSIINQRMDELNSSLSDLRERMEQILMVGNTVDSLLVTLDSPHIVGDVESGLGTVLLNGWLPFDSSRPPRFWKDQQGIVHLDGHVQSGTVSQTAPIFILPPGYRPRSDLLGERIFSVVGNGAFAALLIAPSGAVSLYVGSNTWVGLDGVNFLAEPVTVTSMVNSVNGTFSHRLSAMELAVSTISASVIDIASRLQISELSSAKSFNYAISAASGQFEANSVVSSPVPGLIATITTYGNPVYCQLVPDAAAIAGLGFGESGSSNSMVLYFYRNDTLVGSMYISYTHNEGPAAVSAFDIPPAGIWTYSVNVAIGMGSYPGLVAVSGGRGFLYSVKLLVFEMGGGFALSSLTSNGTDFVALESRIRELELTLTGLNQTVSSSIVQESSALYGSCWQNRGGTCAGNPIGCYLMSSGNGIMSCGSGLCQCAAGYQSVTTGGNQCTSSEFVSCTKA